MYIFAGVMVNKLRSAMVTEHILHASCCCRPLDSGCGMTACRDSGMSFTPPHLYTLVSATYAEHGVGIMRHAMSRRRGFRVPSLYVHTIIY